MVVDARPYIEAFYHGARPHQAPAADEGIPPGLETLRRWFYRKLANTADFLLQRLTAIGRGYDHDILKRLLMAKIASAIRMTERTP